MPTRTYAIILEPAEEGGFVVHVPALPEVCTEGDTEEEALAMAREAIELVLEERARVGEPAPQGDTDRIREVTVAVPEAALFETSHGAGSSRFDPGTPMENAEARDFASSLEAGESAR